MLEQRMLATQSDDAHEFAVEIEPVLAEAELLRIHPRPEGFQLPAAIWKAMFACYALFISALAVATGGDGHARMAIAISALFMLVYFSTASILSAVGGPDRFRVEKGKPLQTLFGPLNEREVWAQVLIIPFALALFGMGILIVTSVIGV